MAEIVLVSVGEEKVKAIKLLREITGFDLKEAKDIIEEVLSGEKYTIADVAERDVEKIVDDFLEIGVYAVPEKEQGLLNNPVKAEVQPGFGQTSSVFNPIVPADSVSQLDRQGTMEVLVEVKKIAEEAEGYENDIADLLGKIRVEQKKAKEIREKLSGKAETVRMVALIVGAIIGTLIVPVIFTIIFGVAAFYIVNATFCKADLREHEAENNQNADNYIIQNVEPLKHRLDEIYALRDDLNNGGKLAWAVDIIGKELFYSACIDDLYNLIKTRRADSLKEALNKYDDEQHKARMEEMQQAIRKASEVTAAESIKQTAYSKDIAKNSQQAATAAKATAYNTRQTARNTKKIAQNTKR